MPQLKPDNIQYSDKYYDEVYEFRHVTLNQVAYDKLPESFRRHYKNIERNDPYVQQNSH